MTRWNGSLRQLTIVGVKIVHRTGSMLSKLKVTDPKRGIAPAKPVMKRGPQVPRSSKRP
jgi:hypothetical protein